jgi:Ser/Thr protein kinase RdoA (MazF antagonist)
MEGMRPVAAEHGLSMIQLACQWNLAQPAVECVVPSLIQELGADALPVESKRAELAELAGSVRLSPADVEEIRRLGDNTGCMALKGANPAFSGEERPDAWGLDGRLDEVARRWGIEPARDLALVA